MSKELPFHLDDRTPAIKELKKYPHWVCYRKEERNGRITKVPYSPWNRHYAQSNVPKTWSDYKTAEATVQKYHFDGLGYMFHQDFTGIDMDHCIDAAGNIVPWAQRVLHLLDSYAETSVNGEGIHIMVRGEIPKGIRRRIPPHLEPQHEQAAIEMYCEKRYFVITGNHLPGTPDEIRSNQAGLTKLFNEVNTDIATTQKKSAVVETSTEPSSTKAAARPPTAVRALTSPATNSTTSTQPPQVLSDDILLQRACAASNGERFRSLYYQSGHNGYPSPSEADIALCLQLAFWTGRDADRMDQLFRQSALYREKWDSKRDETTYGWKTIQRAILHCSEVYTPQQGKAEIIKRIETLLTLVDNEDELIESAYTLELQDINEEKPWYCQPHKVSLHEILACLQENELGDAQLFNEAFHHLACFDFITNSWYIWREHTWQHDLAEKAILLIAVVASIYNKAADILSGQQDTLIIQQIDQMKNERRFSGQAYADKLKVNAKEFSAQIEQLRKRATALHSYKRMRNVIALAAPFMSIRSGIWDQKPFLLPTPNGVLNLETGTCDAGQPGDYLRIACPTTWTGIDTPCPRWERFLQEIFADKPERNDIINFLQRLLGYGITGSTQDHIFSMFYGADGRNGKDTLLGIFHDVMGNLANVVPNDIFLAADLQRSNGSATPHLSLLHGMRSAWGSEPNMGDRIDIGQIKHLTGGGDISTRSLYAKSFYSFTPTHKLFMMTNHKLIISATEEAAWERLCLIDFGMRFLDDPNPNKANERPRDRTLIDTLKQERSGILAWLVRGCLDWQKHGLSIPPIIKKLTRDYQAEEDTLKGFIEDCCHRSSEASVKATPLYNAYKQWHSENQHGRNMTSTMFGREMAKRFERIHDCTGNYYYGIGLGYRSDQPTRPAEEYGGLKGLQTSSEEKNEDVTNESFLETPSNPSYPSGEPLKKQAQSALDFISDDGMLPPDDGYKYDDCDIPCDDASIPIDIKKLDIEKQLPAFLIPPHYSTSDLGIPPEKTYTLESIRKLKKRIQCETCREQWEDIVKYSDLSQAHQGHWWCDRCSNRYELMQLAHTKDYPALSLRHIEIQAGCTSWLIFSRTEHEKRIKYIMDILSENSNI